jgi:hypothetical protein
MEVDGCLVCSALDATFAEFQPAKCVVMRLMFGVPLSVMRKQLFDAEGAL